MKNRALTVWGLGRGNCHADASSNPSATMNPHELLRLVDSLHREKNIDSENRVFSYRVRFGDRCPADLRAKRLKIDVKIDRETGQIIAVCKRARAGSG